MRIKVSLKSKAPLTLPIHYNAMLQGLIYHQLDAHLANWLHGEAYRTGKRSFKLFTFSRLFGTYKIERDKKTIHFTPPVSFFLASHDTEVLASFAEHLLKAPEVCLGRQQCTIHGVEVLSNPSVDISKPVRVKTLAPIVVYSTLSHANGRKKTYYYTPQEPEWGPLVLSNLHHKAQSLGWSCGLPKAARVRPHRVNPRDGKTLLYKKRGNKDFVIKGWDGIYELNLPAPYFWLAYDTGLGAKNAQGFGMVEVC